MSNKYGVRRTGDDDYAKYIKALVAGNPGAGKTKFSVTSPNPFLLSVEGGLMSVYDDDVPHTTMEDLQHNFASGEDGLRELIKDLRKSRAEREQILGVPVDTFVIDTIDEVGKLLMREHVGAGQPRIQDYGWLKEILTNLVRAVRNLDMHIIMTCHLKSVSSEDGDGAPQKYIPAIDGSFAEAIPGYVDLAFVLRNDLDTTIEDGETKRVVNRWLQTYPEPKYDWIKDRSGKLPQRVPINFDDDFSRIADTVFETDNNKESK